MKVVFNPWGDLLLSLLKDSNNSALLVCPFVRSSAIDKLAPVLKGKSGFQLRVLTSLRSHDLITGISEPGALMALLSLQTADFDCEIRAVRNLHAKVYLFDDRLGVVSSANLTSGGLGGNIEVGVLLEASRLVAELREYLDSIWESAYPLDAEALEKAEETAKRMAEIQAEGPPEPDELRTLARLVDRQVASVRPGAVAMEDLDVSEAQPQPTGVKYPQANDVAKILQLPALIERGITTGRQIAEEFGVRRRQGNYYREAAEILGLIYRDPAGVMRVTDAGYRYLRADADDKLVIVRHLMVQCDPIRTVAAELGVDLGAIPYDISAVRRLMDHNRLTAIIDKTSPLTGSTRGRRASSIMAWLRWLLKMLGSQD